MRELVKGLYAQVMAELDLETRVYRECKTPKNSLEIARELGERQTDVSRCLIQLTKDGRVKKVKVDGMTRYQVQLSRGGPLT